MKHMKILVLDNYDSFTYNLVHAVKKMTHHQVDVFRNDEITPQEAEVYDKIILSPGPGIPDEAGVMKDLIQVLAPQKSILGICLGLQGIAEVFGGKLYNLQKVYHGISLKVRIQQEDVLFNGLPTEIYGGRYHSWALDCSFLPRDLEITATDESGIAMAIRHKKYDVRGLQFHPESVMTPFGEKILANWLGMTVHGDTFSEQQRSRQVINK